MDSEIKRIKKLTLFMKKEGLLSIKSKDFELTLSPTALYPPESKQQAVSTQEDEPSYTPEDILLWSTNIPTEEIN